tara:strand:- start:243 stop:533 length:291 start_codon:yes stop_codon:yes gene_type:complete
MGGSSFMSDQLSAHATSTAQMVPTSKRARLTSIQAKGNSANGSIVFKTGGASGTIVATYLFGEEGLDMYLPGSGIFFAEGIHATIGNTAGVTITFT